MKHPFALAAIVTLCLAGIPVPAEETEKDKAREGLKTLQEFIGAWKGTGAPLRPGGGRAFWTEKLDWSWRFKGDDAWLRLAIKDGKHLKGGELRYLPDKKLYRFTAADAKDNKRVFEGEFKNNYLILQRTDPETKETQKITMNTAGDGVRFLYQYERKAENSTIFVREYRVASTKEGESLGAVAKKNECVVTGGLGTMTVSHKGETFYVCCSGCRDAFNENPEKYVAEFKARKSGKK